MSISIIWKSSRLGSTWCLRVKSSICLAQELLDGTRVYREKVSAAEVPAHYKTTKTGCANEDCIIVAKCLIDQGTAGGAIRHEDEDAQEAHLHRKRGRDADSWGTVLRGDAYVGPNLLGRLLMELRDNGTLKYKLPDNILEVVG